MVFRLCGDESLVCWNKWKPSRQIGQRKGGEGMRLQMANLSVLQGIRYLVLVFALNKLMSIYVRDVCSQRSDNYLCVGERLVCSCIGGGAIPDHSQNLGTSVPIYEKGDSLDSSGDRGNSVRNVLWEQV